MVELGKDYRRTFNVLRGDVEVNAIDFRGAAVKAIKWFASGNWPALCMAIMASVFIAGDYGKQAGRASVKVQAVPVPLTSQDHMWESLRVRHHERMAEKNKAAGDSAEGVTGSH